MEGQNLWRACVYLVEADKAEFKYQALAAHGEGDEIRYTRERQSAFVQPAWFGARDYAMMLNKNQLTPAQEGTTFAAADLPKGRFLSEDEIGALMKSERQQQDETFRQSLLRQVSKGPKF
jgi:hypothetical protein